MKKIFLILVGFILTICPAFAGVADVSVAFQKNCFLKKTCQITENEQIKNFFKTQLKYSNSYDFENLKQTYAENYVNSDGLNRKIYFELIGKTWEAYPDIKYTAKVQNISVNGTTAVVNVHETAVATTKATSGLLRDKGLLKSESDSIYYLEKFKNDWLITSDHIIFERTSLTYGMAKNCKFILSAPVLMPSNTLYTASLKLIPPKDTFVIASIGQEQITYPQVNAEDVFRKLPESGILERVFTSNNKNLNEYAVASFGLTKAAIKNGKEIKIYVTGLGFTMLRVNVEQPKPQTAKVSDNVKTK